MQEHPPGDWQPTQRLYVAEFKSGIVKIGITRQAITQNRTASLKWLGSSPIRTHYCDPHESCGHWAERELISRMMRIARTHCGREWFSGVGFGTVKHLAEQITRRAQNGGLICGGIVIRRDDCVAKSAVYTKRVGGEHAKQRQRRREQITTLFCIGVPIAEIASQFGVTPQAIEQFARRRGLNKCEVPA